MTVQWAKRVHIIPPAIALRVENPNHSSRGGFEDGTLNDISNLASVLSRDWEHHYVPMIGGQP